MESGEIEEAGEAACTRKERIKFVSFLAILNFTIFIDLLISLFCTSIACYDSDTPLQIQRLMDSNFFILR